MSNERLEIPRDATLDGTNYTDWKMVTTSVLEQHKMLDLILKAEEDQPEEVRAKALSAKTFLLFSMNRDHRNRINHCTSAREIWLSIANIYENKSKRAINTLWKRLFNFRITHPDKISQGVSEMQTIASNLRARGILIDDSCLIGCIECALPNEFSDWLINWSMRENEPTLNELINSINNHAETLKTTEVKAMIASRTSSKQNPPEKAKKFCKYCKKDNHDITECRKLKRKKAEESQIKQPTQKNFLMMATVGATEKTSWLADSGCSLHMTNNKSWIRDYRELDEPISIRLGDDYTIKALGFGHIKTIGGTIQNVHFVPEIRSNLFSISSATNHGIEVSVTQKGMKFLSDGEIVTTAIRRNNVYYMNFEVIIPQTTTCAAATLDEWHARFGHISHDALTKIKKSSAVIGLEIRNNSEKPCEDCALNKCKSTSHPPRSSAKASEPGQSIHADTSGPIQVPGIEGQRFILLCKDEFSGFRVTSCIKSKSQVPEELMQIISKTQLETGNRPLRLCTDQGTEYLNQRLASFLTQNGIIHQKSSVYTPQQNGYIEREFQTLIGMARTLLNSSKLPETLWPEAVYTSNYILNRTLAKEKQQTPFELWHGVKPNIKNLRIFGQNAIIRNDRDVSKFGEHGRRVVFVGYTNTFNTYRFFNLKKNSIEISCNVKFLSNIGCNDVDNNTSTNIQTENISVPIVDDAIEEIYANIHDNHSISGQAPRVASPQPNVPPRNSDSLEPVYDNIQITDARRSSTPRTNSIAPNELSHATPQLSFISAPNRAPAIQNNNTHDISKFITATEESNSSLDQTLQPPVNDHDYSISINNYQAKKNEKSYGLVKRILNTATHKANACIDDQDPQTFKQAMSRADSAQWLEAMHEELASLERCKVWELVNRPESNVVSCRWVYKTKRSPDDRIERYRARLVARGFTQEKGKDYFETYSPVCDTSAIRLLFAFAAMEQLKIRQFDVKAAFLYGELNEEVFIEQPPGFDSCKSKVYRLHKALYGLKQASKQWSKRFSGFLKNLGFSQSWNDNCIFHMKDPFIILAIYVDDAIVLAKQAHHTEDLITQLRKEFDIHLVNNNVFLGFQYQLNQDGSISLHQTSYVKKIIQQYNMAGANPMSTPGTLLNDDIESEPLNSNTPFRQAIGSLLYAAGATRPDIAHAVITAAQASQSPTEADWTKVKRIFRYLRGNPDLGITFHPKNQHKIEGYCDASFARHQDFKSTTGYLFTLAGGPISWKSKKQDITTTSTCESEFVSLCEATKDAVWLRNLAIELSIMQEKPIELFCDNTSSIKIAENETAAKRTRHLGAQVRYPREQVENGIIQVSFIPGKQQPADMLTKPLGPQAFLPARDRIMTRMLVSTITILSMIGIVAAHRFSHVDPILYESTDHFISDEITEYIHDFSFINPCKSLRAADDSFWSVITMDYHTELSVKEKCEESYREDWLKIVNEIPHIHSPHPIDISDIRIRKRGIIGDIAIGGAGFALGLTTSNFLRSTLQLFGYQDATEVHISQINEHLNNIDVHTASFNKQFNIQTHFNEVVINQLKHLAKGVQRNQKEIERIKTNIPKLTWLVSYLQHKISRSSQALTNIINGYKRGIAATNHLAILLNFTMLYDVNEQDTIMYDISLLRNDTIRFNFLIRKPDTNTAIVKIISFKHWRNLESKPQLVEYHGKPFAVYNRTNNCIIGIDPPTHRFITEECSTPNYVDPQVEQWHIVNPESDKKVPYPVSSFHPGLTNNYIYCYTDTILFGKSNKTCPPEVFKLPSNNSFQTFSKPVKFTAKKRLLHSNKITESTIEDIHPEHFKTPIINITNFYSRVTELEKLNEQLNTSSTEHIKRFIGSHPSQSSSALIILAAIILIILIRSRQSDSQASPIPLRAPPLPPKD